MSSSTNANILSSGTATLPSIPITHSSRPIERILGEGSRQRLLTAHLLTAHKAVDCYGNRTVNVMAAAVFAQAHFGERFANTEDRLEVTDLLHENQQS